MFAVSPTIITSTSLNPLLTRKGLLDRYTRDLSWQQQNCWCGSLWQHLVVKRHLESQLRRSRPLLWSDASQSRESNERLIASSRSAISQRVLRLNHFLIGRLKNKGKNSIASVSIQPRTDEKKEIEDEKVCRNCNFLFCLSLSLKSISPE